MLTEPYTQQQKLWPTEGQHILAQYDKEAIVVYQAYKPSIGLFAAKHQYFGGDFSYSRMSWIKTSFLWMMYRSGWGTKPNQEITLAISLKRSFFDCLLEQAVVSSFALSSYSTHADWELAIAESDVRLQWDPDHSPTGRKLTRKAIQLGLRGDTLKDFGQRAILSVEDISTFVKEQRKFVQGNFENLRTPSERIYIPVSKCV
ncbi:MAG: DUF4291 domain-containing protein [Ardenticatenaceae bacterium]|nr:DUF4291 domain-containing protein [Anaerolineales bacterium]MCB8922513.1 DUF4291 domain-containing protein [Ardenticatenaceae bacterium]MCB8989982.1 DUF4291 domain-containing protein [Ardenticatenaceae bacterium]